MEKDIYFFHFWLPGAGCCRKKIAIARKIALRDSGAPHAARSRNTRNYCV